MKEREDNYVRDFKNTLLPETDRLYAQRRTKGLERGRIER